MQWKSQGHAHKFSKVFAFMCKHKKLYIIVTQYSSIAPVYMNPAALSLPGPGQLLTCSKDFVLYKMQVKLVL